jgi:hypothetical protein
MRGMEGNGKARLERWNVETLIERRNDGTTEFVLGHGRKDVNSLIRRSVMMKWDEIAN